MADGAAGPFAVLNQAPPHRDTGKRGKQMRCLDVLAPLSYRAKGDEPGFAGRVSSWWVVDSFGTCRAPGAFTRTIDHHNQRVPVLRNHYTDARVGQTIALTETDEGLDVDARLTDDDNGPGHWLIASMRAGDDWGISFGFETLQARATTDADPLILTHAPRWVREDPTWVTVMTECRLWEVSPVTFPSDPTAAVTDVRSFQAAEIKAAIQDEINAGRLTRQELLAYVDQLDAAAIAPGSDRGETLPAPPTAIRAAEIDLYLIELMELVG